ncbi:hypothetical protein [Nocardia sp. NPDC057030]|uniref:hypothetical protein n=1 Tax=unclassified Nocardia TaxID=2637762 RepID=UPI003641F855
MLLHNGLTVSQLHLLDTDCFTITDDAGVLRVRSLNGQVRTTVLATSTREALRRWMIERRAILRRSGRRRRALSISRDGRDTRLVRASIDRLVSDIGRESGSPRLSLGILCYTF